MLLKAGDGCRDGDASGSLCAQEVQVHYTNGIIAVSPEKTMQNIGTLSTQGMIETDRTILRIMMEKEFSEV